MANKKLSEQTEITSADSTDIIHVVVDPGGTPTSYKIQKDNFLKDCVSQDESPSLSADLDAQGNYAVDLQNFSDMLAGDGPGYWFDGTNDAITISDDSNLDFDTDDDFYIQILIKPSDITRTTDYLINKEAGGIGWGLYINQDDLYIRIDDGTNDATAIIGTAVFVNNTWALITVIFDRSGNATAYINGNLVGTVDISSVVNTIANAGDFHIGNDSAGGNEFKGEIQLCNVGNLAITEQAIINGAPIPYKYIGASQTDIPRTFTINVGSPIINGDEITFSSANESVKHLSYWEVGKVYRITTTVASYAGTVDLRLPYDGGANLGETVNSDGTYTYEYIPTTANMYISSPENSSGVVTVNSIIQIGCVLNLNPSGIGTSTWRDDSGNNLDGTVSGALPVNKTPINDFESTGIDDNATSTAITIDSYEKVGIGTTDIEAKLNIVGNDASGGGLVVDNETDEEMLKQVIFRAGVTTTQKRYMEWQDYDDTVVGRFGWNATNGLILYHNQGGVDGAAYHPFFSSRLSDSGLTCVNSSSGVYLNYDGTATGTSGLVVWDGTPSGSVTIANKYGSINSTGVQANNGREIRAFATGDVNYTRLLTTSIGYLDSTQALSIRSSADSIKFVDSSYGEKIRIDTATGNLGINTSSFGTSAAKVLGLGNGTAPTTSPADMVQMWSADQVEGNACLHTRTEGGAVIKLYQQALIADAPGDTAANNAVTINAILDLLENNGLMASS